MSRETTDINTDAISRIALSVRSLAMDAIEQANSGHPGLPLGCAELGAVLYAHLLSYFPDDPDWPDRDRFVLSAGHGSMLLYSLLHLAGYNLPLDDIKRFRQPDSKAPGHPEYGVTPGVETTTGPLGQGFANAVGMAMAETMLSSRFNTPDFSVVDHYTYVLAGDGDLMEGITSEAASIAGHLGLGKLIVFYDSNRITIEGSTDLAFSEDVGKRFEAFKWHVQKGDAYDVKNIVKMVMNAKEEKGRPSLIILDSVIAKGSVNLEGSHEAHGAPLGKDEVAATKKALGIPADASFYIHPDAIAFFKKRKDELKTAYEAWKERFRNWQQKYPDLKKHWDMFFDPSASPAIKLPVYKTGDKSATRVASGQAMNMIAESMPNFIGGSADLAPSNNTALKGCGDFSGENPSGRNLHFGIREHAMGGICNGIALHKGIRIFCATFLIFSDYMRPSIRLASLMGLPIIYVFTHDSVFVGEDGPTHQPVEQIASLRIIPGIRVLRPADAEETARAWEIALQTTDRPVALILTRQKLEVFGKADQQWRDRMAKGAYVAKESNGKPDVVIAATGSEVNLALSALKKRPDVNARVISMPCMELFRMQPESFRNSMLPPDVKRLFIEAGVSASFGIFTQPGDRIIGLDRFGESGPGEIIASRLGLNEDEVCKAIDALSGKK